MRNLMAYSVYYFPKTAKSKLREDVAFHFHHSGLKLSGETHNKTIRKLYLISKDILLE